MKSITKVHATRITVFATVLLAALIFTGSANAQNTFQGTFTLGHSARWGKTVLGAGDYIVRVNSTNGSAPYIAEITYAKSGRPAALETCSNADTTPSKGEKSALILGHRGGQPVVHSFRVAELGETFIFDRTLASRQGAEEAMNQENIPVLTVKR
jgi:hypothetical protein